MTLLSYTYRTLSNFVFLGLAYFSLNYVEKYENRTILAVLILVYGAMHVASAFRSFYFFKCIERLEGETRRLASAAGDGPIAAASRKQIAGRVMTLRHAGEVKLYIDLFFLTLVMLLCVAKIAAN